jgi:hypothetical protein
MKRIFLTAIVIAMAGLLPAAAIAQKKQPGNLTLTAPETVKFGRAVTLSGKLTGPNNDNKAVTLREDPFPFATFDDVAPTATTNAQGDYSFVRSPTVNTRYQTRQGGVESQVVTVLVSPTITLGLSDRTPRAGRRVRFFGRLCPEHDGQALVIQRRTAPKQWRNVASTTLADAGTTCSTYSRRVRVRRDGTYRTRFGGHDDHAAGNSRARRIDVHS